MGLQGNSRFRGCKRPPNVKHGAGPLHLTLACDASPFGIGAVLSHQLPNCTEVPLAYFSCTLSAPDRNYSQIVKKALAAVAGIKRFHDYLYDRFFELITLGLLPGDKQMPQILSPRMSWWTIFLALYNYKLMHCPGKQLGHADALSHCL